MNFCFYNVYFYLSSFQPKFYVIIETEFIHLEVHRYPLIWMTETLHRQISTLKMIILMTNMLYILYLFRAVYHFGVILTMIINQLTVKLSLVSVSLLISHHITHH